MTAGIVINVSTANFRNITISWALRHSNKSTNKAVLFYGSLSNRVGSSGVRIPISTKNEVLYLTKALYFNTLYRTSSDGRIGIRPPGMRSPTNVELEPQFQNRYGFKQIYTMLPAVTAGFPILLMPVL